MLYGYFTQASYKYTSKIVNNLQLPERILQGFTNNSVQYSPVSKLTADVTINFNKKSAVQSLLLLALLVTVIL